MSGLAGIFDFSGDFQKNFPLWTSYARRMHLRIRHRGHHILREQITEHGILLQGDSEYDTSAQCDSTVFTYEHCSVILDGYLSQKDTLCRTLRRNKIPCCPNDPDRMLIILSYLSFGNKMVQHLHGGFSFVLYDAFQQKILLARDAFGVKPLFFTSKADCMIFASEIKGLLEHPDVLPEVTAAGLSTLLLRTPYTVGHPVFAGIRELPPGTCTVFDRSGCTEHRFFTENTASIPSSEDSGNRCIHAEAFLPVSAEPDDFTTDWIRAIIARDLPGTAFEDSLLLRMLKYGAAIEDIVRAGFVFFTISDKSNSFTLEHFSKILNPEIAAQIRPYIQNHAKRSPTVFAKRALLLERLDRCLAQSGRQLQPEEASLPDRLASGIRTAVRFCPSNRLQHMSREKLNTILCDPAQPLRFLFSADALRRMLSLNPDPITEIRLIQLNLWMNRYAVRFRF